MPKKAVKLSDKDICEKWLKNKTENPETLRKIKETGLVYKNLAKKCLKDLKDLKKVKDIKEVKDVSSSKSSKSYRTAYLSLNSSSKESLKTANSSINSEKNKIKAYKKIYKLFAPYIKRITPNIIDRINYYLIIKKYLLSIKDTKNCVRLYNIDNKTNKPIYRVGKNIILDKQIGQDSVFGIVFLSHFKSDVKLGTSFDKLNKFAVKITNQSKNNKNEIQILNKLTKLVIDFKCPHFPISYGSLRCNNTFVKSNNPDDYPIVADKHKKKKLLPKLVNKNKTLLIQINELASGDLDDSLLRINKDKLNTITQVLLSLMFFHYYTKSFHTDPHTGNFLYHNIKPGGYFHYNIYGIDYYLENKGLLWVIWDFGVTISFDKNINLPISEDYDYILNSLDNFEFKFTATENTIIKNLHNNIIKKYSKIKDTNKLETINKEILEFLLINVNTFKTIKPDNIINKTPYTILSTITPIVPPIVEKPSFFKGFINYFTKQ